MFKERLIESFQEGILIAVKWGFISFLVIYSFYYITDTRRMAFNGQNAAEAIREFQQKGYLPQFINGTVPMKEEKKEEK